MSVKKRSFKRRNEINKFKKNRSLYSNDKTKEQSTKKPNR